MRQVVIISNDSDPHAQRVAEYVRADGASVSVMDTSTLLASMRVDFKVDAQKLSGSIRDAVKTIDLAGSSFWLRRLAKPEVAPAPEEWVERSIQLETSKGLEGILGSFGSRCVNDPGRQKNARVKVSQLAAAFEAGLPVPKTLITNVPETAREFYDECAGDVVYKLIDESTQHLLPLHRNPSGLPTLPVREFELDNLTAVSKSLHLFQERIKKVHDFRITIAGDKIFAARIETSVHSPVDVRLSPSAVIAVDSLPAEIESALFRLMQQLGLCFACVDMALEDSGRMSFFELNPQGQFLWIEDATGLEISKALAELLCSK